MSGHVSMMGLSMCGDSAQLHIPAHNPTIVTTRCTVLYCSVLYCTVPYCTVLYHTVTSLPDTHLLIKPFMLGPLDKKFCGGGW